MRVEIRTQYGTWVLWSRVADLPAAKALRAELRAEGKEVRIREERAS